MAIARILALISMLALISSGKVQAELTRTSTDEQAVHAFLRRYFDANEIQHDLDEASKFYGPTKVSVAFADLNGDGRTDALAYVSGGGFCGSGGCKLYVLKNTTNGYRVVGRTTITWQPISLLVHRTNGWRDISVLVAGGGIVPGYEAVLGFDGWKYPGNPSMQTARRYLHNRAGKVVIRKDAPSAPL